MGYLSIFFVSLALALADNHYCSTNKCTKDFIKILKKAESGDTKSQNKVGEMLHFGEGVEKNFSEARGWYLKASESGHAEAANHLGRLYFNGEGVEKDYKEACKWYKVSSERGDKNGRLNYKRCLKSSGT
ncbi:MAG: sel1 repeat family protein [Bdellovibrionaceae bacterium]|nr:sel1 repeat family protein [Pseudobdellovibrionaceae bacterium]NUM60289.1 sel1 repeat family protein [Pseudobdellovibrionaceae bacterium]